MSSIKFHSQLLYIHLFKQKWNLDMKTSFHQGCCIQPANNIQWFHIKYSVYKLHLIAPYGFYVFNIGSIFLFPLVLKHSSHVQYSYECTMISVHSLSYKSLSENFQQVIPEGHCPGIQCTGILRSLSDLEAESGLWPIQVTRNKMNRKKKLNLHASFFSFAVTTWWESVTHHQLIQNL